MYLQTDGDVIEDPDVTREEIKMILSDPSVRRLLQRGAESKNHDREGDSACSPPLCLNSLAKKQNTFPRIMRTYGINYFYHPHSKPVRSIHRTRPLLRSR
jgi:hypothetical protein